MAQTVLITLTTAGADTGPFNLYSNIDGYTVPFESSISKAALEAGFTSYLVPDGTLTIRVQSMGPLCENFLDLAIVTTTTTTTTTSTTTTTTTTEAPSEFYYTVNVYTCGDCVTVVDSGVISSPTSLVSAFYASLDGTQILQITGTTSPSVVTHFINEPSGGPNCVSVACGG